MTRSSVLFAILFAILVGGIVLALRDGSGTRSVQVVPGMLGMTVERVRDRSAPSVVVTSLQTGGAGSMAGLKVGDRIEAVDGSGMAVAKTVQDDASTERPPVDIRVWRAGRVREIRIADSSGG